MTTTATVKETEQDVFCFGNTTLSASPRTIRITVADDANITATSLVIATQEFLAQIEATGLDGDLYYVEGNGIGVSAERIIGGMVRIEVNSPHQGDFADADIIFVSEVMLRVGLLM